MQATLLGFAIALILALVAALVGPYFVDWNNHRAMFEAKASQLVGLQVNVAGDIDARILPFPSVRLDGVSIGSDAHKARLRSQSLRIELALGSLMRGEIRAVEMRLVKPEFDVGLDREGRIDWPAVVRAPETLSIDRLTVEDGRATLADARTGADLVLEQLWFNGELRSLAGPVRGRGEFVAGGGAYGYSVSASRHGADGARVRLTLETAERPLTVEAEGLVAFENVTPRFEGMLRLSRPASSVLADGRAVAHEPWRLTGKVQAGRDSARFEDIEFQYGPDDRATTLGGAGEFVYGARPELRADLVARQIDFDRMLATADAPRRLPFSAVRALGDVLGGALRPPWPLRLAVRADLATLGGAPLQGLAAEVHSDGQDWQLDRLEFRAPGFTQVRLSGRLYPVGAGLGFAGDASVEAGDPRTLFGWLAGQPGEAGPLKPWQAKGVVTLGADRIAVERLETEFGRGAIRGRVGYSWSAGERPARLDAELKAAELDLDAVLGFGRSALSGLGFERPGEADIAIDIGRARLAGLEAQTLTARLKFDAGGVTIERVSVADFGNATVVARGRIAGEGGKAEDNIAVDLDARELDGFISLAESYAPALAVPLRRLAGAQGSAKLRAVLSLERAASDSRKAQVLVDGRIGALRANVVVTAESKSGDFTGIDLAAFADANIALGVQFVADEGAALLAALGLDRIPAAAGRAGRLVLSARGPLGEALRFDGKLVAGSIDAEGEGVLRMSAERPAAIALDGFSGSVGGHKVSGKLSVQLGDAARLEGEIDAETLDAAATVAAAAGAPAGTGTRDTEGWPQDPFAAPRSDLSGRIAFKARRATLAGNMTAEMLQGVARFSRGEVVFENVHGVLGNGRFEAELELTGEAGGLAARARVTLHDAEAAALFGDADPPPIAGKLRFQAEVAGSGRSPAAFIGSLSGNGSVTLDNGRLAGLNPEVFEAAIRAAEIGAPIDGPRVNAFASGMLAGGSLAVPRAQASIGISSGLARIAEVSAPQAVGFEANGFLDLASGTIDAQVTLTGRTALANGARPALQVAIRGAVSSPLRAVDATPFANWLTMRAVEQQAKQLEAIERENRARESREKEMREKDKFDRESRERDAPGLLPPRTEVPEAAPEIRQASEQAPPLPPPVSVPAGPRTGRTPAARPAPDPRPDTAIRPPGLIGAQH